MSFGTVLRGLVTWILLAGTCTPGLGAESDPVPTEFIVHFREAAHPGMPARTGRKIRPGVRLHSVESGGPPGTEQPAAQWRRLHQAMARWRARSDVLLVEPNYYGRFQSVAESPPPNDPGFADQWWATAVGALGLWPIGRGQGIRVAVVDSGISVTHPDLRGSLDADGYDFGDDDTDPDDGYGHGTSVAGIIAARVNDGVGIAGLAPEARLLSLKVSRKDSNGKDSEFFTHDTVARAIDYAVAKGVRIINLSITFDQETETLRKSVQSALDHGVAVIAAAGNSAGPVSFPANIPGVVAVAGSDRHGALYATSNRGPEVTIAAPGIDIYTTALAGAYVSRGGTSFAAPMVAAAFAALMSANPSLPVSALRSLLRATSAPLDGQSFGVLRAGQAALSLLPALSLPQAAVASRDTLQAAYLLPLFGATVDLYVAVTTPAGEFDLLPDCTWGWVATDGYRPFALRYMSSSPASGSLFGSGGICGTIPLVNLPAGTYQWRVAATDSASGRLVGAVNTESLELRP